MSYRKTLKEIVVYIGESAPDYIEKFGLGRFDPNTSDDKGEVVDYTKKDTYPVMFIPLKHKEDDTWKINGVQLWAYKENDRGVWANKFEILAAYVLQELGFVQDIVEVISIEDLNTIRKFKEKEIEKSAYFLETNQKALYITWKEE